MKSKTYSRRTGFRNWVRRGQQPAEIAAAEVILDSASNPQPSPLTGPAESQTTPTVPPASAITVGEASLSEIAANNLPNENK